MPKVKTRGPGRLNKSVKEAVEYAFNKVNNGGDYLLKVANDDPKTFLALVAKCIPTAVAVDVKHTIDLAGAMLASQQQLKELANNQEIKTIEHEHVTPDSQTGDNETRNTKIPAKPLETKEK